jgi:hypothetical protein
MFKGYEYTVSITLSGALIFPFAMGPIGNFGMLFVVIVYPELSSSNVSIPYFLYPKPLPIAPSILLYPLFPLSFFYFLYKLLFGMALRFER